MTKEIRLSAHTSPTERCPHALQQVFLGKDVLLFYYLDKRRTSSSGNRRPEIYYSGFAVQVPYDSKCTVSGDKIQFSGNLTQAMTEASNTPESITDEDADVIIKEATLTLMNPSRPIRSTTIYNAYDPQAVRQITDAFHESRPNIAESGKLTSWRILLDRYLIQKRDNLDTADTVIQTYWYADYLARRRQARLDVTASTVFDPGKSAQDSLVSSFTEGRCKRTSVITKGNFTYQYSRKGQILAFSTKLPPIFNILDTQNPTESRICPNCGSECKTSEAVNGCPFCGTRFRLIDYDYKVSGSTLFHARLSLIRLMLVTIIPVMILSFVVTLVLRIPNITVVDIVSAAFLTPLYGMIGYMVLSVPIGIIYFSRIVRLNRFRDFCKPMKRNDPLLSIDEFEADVESRIRTFFLSEESDNIRFVSGVKPGQYTDVVDVRIHEYKRLNEVPAPGFQIIRAHAVLDMIRLKEDKLILEKERFAFDIYRKEGTKTSLRADREVFTCPSCGGSLSILDGGHCKLCGSTSDMSRFGWVLGAVSKE